MPHIATSQIVKQVRREMLVTLKSVYPSALPVEVLFRAVMAVVANRDPSELRADLIYLCEKGYVEPRTHPDDPNGRKTAWRRRWVRLTPAGVEVADCCVRDPALEL